MISTDLPNSRCVPAVVFLKTLGLARACLPQGLQSNIDSQQGLGNSLAASRSTLIAIQILECLRFLL